MKRLTLFLTLILLLPQLVFSQSNVSNPTTVTPHLTILDWLKVNGAITADSIWTDVMTINTTLHYSGLAGGATVSDSVIIVDATDVDTAMFFHNGSLLKLVLDSGTSGLDIDGTGNTQLTLTGASNNVYLYLNDTYDTFVFGGATSYSFGETNFQKITMLPGATPSISNSQATYGCVKFPYPGVTIEGGNVTTTPGDIKLSITYAGGSVIIDGNKTTANVLEVINDNDGAVGDSSTVITSTGQLTTPTLNVGYNGSVDGQINFTASDGDAGYMAINTADQLTFSNFGAVILNTNDVRGGSAVNYTSSTTVGTASIKANGATSSFTSYGSGNATKPYDTEIILYSGGNGTARVIGNKTTSNVLEVTNKYDESLTDSSYYFTTAGNLVINSSVTYNKSIELADGAQHLLPTGVEGFGKAMCNGEIATFYFLSDGTVSMVAASTAGLTTANISTTEDNDGTLNVFDDGSGIGIENELGDTYTVLISITYQTP